MKGNAMNDPMKLLISDHREARNLLHDLKKADLVPAQTELLNSIEKLLKSHWAIERDLVYPLMISARLEPQALEAEVEHQLQDECLSQLMLLRGEPGFASVVAMLAGAFKHHTKHEERHLLPALKAALGEEEWEALGDRLLVAQSVVEAKGRVTAKAIAEEVMPKAKPQKTRKPLTLLTLTKKKLPAKKQLVRSGSAKAKVAKKSARKSASARK
jgi:Hemerythrin HHE cation binding domain